MSDSPVERHLSNELSNGSFQKPDFNALFEFAHLSRVDLIQSFNDVLAEIDPSQKVNARHEDPNTTVIRILEFLRILKYMPPDDDPTIFRNGIAEGNPDIIVPIMTWICNRKNILKKRAYLAKYLIKIEFPDVMAQDEEAVKSYEQYESLLEKFIEIDKNNENLKNRNSVTALIQNIEKSECEQDCLRRKIDYIKSRIDTKPNKTFQLSDVKLLRSSKEKKRELNQQLKLEEKYFKNSEEKKVLMRKELHTVTNMYNSVTAEGIFRHMDTETNSLKKLVYHKLPYEIKVMDRRIRALRSVESQPHENHDDIKYLKTKIATIAQEVKQLESQAKVKQRGEASFVARQKAIASERKRKLLFEEVQLLSNQLTELKYVKIQLIDEQNRKKQEIEIKNKEFKTFLKSFKIKVTHYKENKNDIDFFKSETGILLSTKFILDGKFKDIKKELNDIEIRIGITGLSKTQEKLESISAEKNIIDEQKNQLLYEMSIGVKEINEKIATKKSQMEPLVKSASILRGQIEMIQNEYDKLKINFIECSGECERKNEQMQSNVNVLKTQLNKNELKYLKLKECISALKIKIKLATQEKLYQNRDSKNPNGRIRSLKQKLLGKIVEQERIGGNLEADILNFDKFEKDCKNQKKMWIDTIKLLEWKLKSKELVLTNEEQ